MEEKKLPAEIRKTQNPVQWGFHEEAWAFVRGKGMVRAPGGKKKLVEKHGVPLQAETILESFKTRGKWLPRVYTYISLSFIMFFYNIRTSDT